MKKILIALLLAPGLASAALIPSTSTLANQGAPGTNDWPVKLTSTTVTGTVTANQGTAGVGWDIDLSTGVQVNGTVGVTNLFSGTTVYIVNPTTGPVQVMISGGNPTSVGYQTSGASVPVSVLNIVTCDTQTVINTSSSGDIFLSSATGSGRVYVCSYNMISAGTTNVKFLYGTGATCATGQLALTGAYPLIANTGIAAGTGLGVILRTPASNNLCLNNSAAVSIQGVINWTSF